MQLAELTKVDIAAAHKTFMRLAKAVAHERFPNSQHALSELVVPALRGRYEADRIWTLSEDETNKILTGSSNEEPAGPAAGAAETQRHKHKNSGLHAAAREASQTQESCRRPRGASLVAAQGGEP